MITFYVENRAARCERIYLGMGNPLKVVATLVSYIAVGFANSISRVVRLSIAQLVERRTVDEKIAILRSLVRIRFGRIIFLGNLFFLLKVQITCILWLDVIPPKTFPHRESNPGRLGESQES